MTGITGSNFLSLWANYAILYWFVYFITCLICLIIFSYIFTSNRIGLYTLLAVRHCLLFHVGIIACFISLAGFPPFIGFWTKLTLASCISQSASIFSLIIFWGLLLLSLLFYLRILRYFYAWSVEYVRFAAIISSGHISILVWLIFFICCGGLLINDLLLFSAVFLL